MDTIPTLQQLSDEMDMDTADVLHLMSIYRAELKRDMAVAQNLLSRQRWNELREQLHKLKGDASELCMHHMAALAAEMGALLRENPPAADSAPLWNDIVRESEAILAFIDGLHPQ